MAILKNLFAKNFKMTKPQKLCASKNFPLYSISEEGGSDISATKKYFIMPLNLWLQLYIIDLSY